MTDHVYLELRCELNTVVWAMCDAKNSNPALYATLKARRDELKRLLTEPEPEQERLFSEREFIGSELIMSDGTL